MKPALAHPFQAEKIRDLFPALSVRVNGKPLIYFDNAATTQKPLQVIERMNRYYREENANVHRGIHTLSQVATDRYEAVRKQLAGFIGAESDEAVVFTSGATEGINLVASGFLLPRLKPGDVILLSGMEHHSNIVPWQLAAEKAGATIRVIPVTDRGELDLESLPQLLNGPVKMVSVVHMSNTLGTVNPVKEIIRLAHQVGAAVLVDAAQSLPHFRLNVQTLGCDFLVASGHKVFGPTGTGFLYGKPELLKETQPFHGGGNMIRTVTFEKTTWNDPPFRFEAGTPNIAGGLGLGAAIEFMETLDWLAVHEYEQSLLRQTTAVLRDFPGVRIIGEAAEKGPVVSFVMEGAHASDLGTLLDQEGIAIRTGHHCTQPLMKRFGVPATARVSLSFYNTPEEVDQLGRSLRKVSELMG